MPENGSVILEPPKGTMPFVDYIISVASVADELPAWGTSPFDRDRELRKFWPTEPILAGALFSTVARYAGFQWTLRGPDRMTRISDRMLRSVEFGKGWANLILKVLLDLFTQDNGAFIEVIRTSDAPSSPCITLNHLDSNRCIRTGRREEPVIYVDRLGVGHSLKWYQVVTLEEFPSPIETMYNAQICAVSRLLRAAQIMRDISIYKREKIGGRFTRTIYIVGGVHQRTIEAAIKTKQSLADSQGLTRYIDPVIIGSIDPTATVSVANIELASLPESFNEETAMKWYVNQLALTFGGDYQDYAPLPAGNLGTSEQSETLHMKSRGKGPRLFMKMLEQVINYNGILPATVVFTYGEQDVAETLETAQLKKIRAEERKIRLDSGEITPEVARQVAVDTGDLDARYLEMFNEQDITRDTRVKD